MRDWLYCIGLFVVVGLVVGYLVSHRPNIKSNEANGSITPDRFKGYKESLKTTVNQGTPLYGETVTGWTTSTFRSGEGA